MKKLSTILLLLTISSTVFAQGNFKVVQEQQAHYPAGDVALQEYFNYKLIYPEIAIQNKVYGSVMLSFDVLPDSSLRDIVVLSGVGFGVDDLVIGLLNHLKFAPAVSNGVAIRSNMIVVVNVKAMARPTLEIEKE